MTALFAVLALSLAVALVLARRPPARADGDAVRDRATLIAACIDVADHVESHALREQIVDALTEVGVLPVVVDAGEAFDSTRHRAVGRVPTHDGTFHNLVANTERAGYADHGKRVRWPEVLVFDANEEMAA